MMRCLALSAGLIFTTASAALAQNAAPIGIVDDPCIGAPTMPPSALAYFRSWFDPAAKRVIPPAADLAAYKAAQDVAAKRDWPNLCHYRADNARLVLRPQSERRIVYMGDSITEAWALADTDFFTGGRINRGISGQTTAQMLLRFQADVIALHPKVVHILAGTNDLAGNTGPETMQDVRNNIIAMVTLAKANRIRIVLASIMPASRFPWSPALKPAPQIRAINDWLRLYARSVGVTYVDYYRLMATADGAMQPALTLDGVHPSALGYQTIRTLSTTTTDNAAGTGGK